MRAGLRIVGQRGHPEVKDALIKFARWLRTHNDFPIRVPVYLRPEAELTNMSGENCSASFFGPWEHTVEPYIRIATGGYEKEKQEYGRDDALTGYLVSLAHEVIHYQQWVADNQLHQRGVAVKAANMVKAYALTTERP